MIFHLHLCSLLFVGLKLTGFIDWSWWLVLLPSIFVAVVGLTVAAVAIWIMATATKPGRW